MRKLFLKYTPSTNIHLYPNLSAYLVQPCSFLKINNYNNITLKLSKEIEKKRKYSVIFTWEEDMIVYVMKFLCALQTMYLQSEMTMPCMSQFSDVFLKCNSLNRIITTHRNFQNLNAKQFKKQKAYTITTKMLYSLTMSYLASIL